ncbi:unnamed protein product [Sphagnum balticum]
MGIGEVQRYVWAGSMLLGSASHQKPVGSTVVVQPPHLDAENEGAASLDRSSLVAHTPDGGGICGRVLERKHQRVVSSGRGPPLLQLARWSHDLGDPGAQEEEEEWEMLLNNRYERQKPTSAPMPQGRASRLLVQQKEDAKERVMHQRSLLGAKC